VACPPPSLPGTSGELRWAFGTTGGLVLRWPAPPPPPPSPAPQVGSGGQLGLYNTPPIGGQVPCLYPKWLHKEIDTL
jgi:hypothetical protein